MLWGGRFSAAPDPDMLALTASIATDLRLLPYDVEVTKAHARVLASAGLLEAAHVAEIDRVLDGLVEEWREGTLEVTPSDEDVHSLVERRLTEALGETGQRIHAGRSRNDLVATDLRLYCREAAASLALRTRELIEILCDIAAAHTETVMPGYTHLQRGQPVSLAFHLLAHGFALARDGQRFKLARAAADVSPLGAGALAGTTLPLRPEVGAEALGFGTVFDNAMDATADRDFALDLLYACACCSVHISRLAEEIVLWTSGEFGFARPSDAWSTGSSMMPNKRNPDMAELVRGRAAASVADLTGLLVLLKGLPLAYDRDLQEDKGFVFSAVDRTLGALRGIAGIISSLTFDTEAMAAAASEGGAWATDIAETLVARGVPFREAHAAAGRLVAALEERGLRLYDAPYDLLAGIHPELRVEDREAADPARSLRSRAGHGGTAPERVAEQIEVLRGRASAIYASWGSTRLG